MTPTASPAPTLAPPVSLPSSPERPAGRARSRLHGIDGLRAFAALWVVLFHIRAFSGAQLTGVPGLDLFIRSGSTGVSLFLVLSGFCLYLPYAGGRLSRFSGGRFFARRCRRLLPAYYATLGVIVVVYSLASGHAGLAHMSAAGLVGQSAAHLAVVHQLLPSTFYGLNGAYWSLGLEWELYLTLPLLILGVRRIGLGRTVAMVLGLNVAYRLALAVAAGHGLVGPHTTLATVVLPNFFLGRWGEFGLGMLAAELYVSGRAGLWGRRLIVPAVLAVPASFLIAGNPLAHLLFGVIFFTVVCLVADGGNPVARVFSWTPLVVLGAMSYSIYLVHQPLVEVGAHLLGAGNGASPRRVFLELVALIPVLLVAAWILFVTVERRTVGASSLGGLRGERLLFPTFPKLRPRRERRPEPPDQDGPPASPEGSGDGGDGGAGSRGTKAAAAERPRLGANISALAASQAVTWTMSLLWTLVVPRLLGAPGMGLLVSALSASALFGVVLGYGTKDYLVRSMVANRREAPQTVGTALVLRAALTPVYVGGVVLYSHLAHLGSEARLVLFLVAGATLCTLLVEPVLAAFQAIERMEYLAFGDVFDKTTQSLLGIGLAVLGFGAVGLTACSLVMSALGVGLFVHWVRSHVRIELRTSVARIRRLFVESLPYWAFGVFFMAYLWIDSVMLSLMTRPEVVGWYGVPTKLFMTLMFAPAILSTAWLPRLVSAFEESPDRLRAVARAPVELVFVLSLPICVMTAMSAGGAIPLLFGNGYRNAVPVMVVLALCLPPMYLNIMLNQVLVAAKRPLVWTWLMAGATIVNPVLNLLLIRAFEARSHNGAIGSAIALAVTEGLVLVGGMVIVGRWVLTGSSLLRFVRAALATAAMAAVMYALRSFGFVVAGAAGAVSFLALAFLLRLASPDEVAMLRSGAAGLRGRLRLGQKPAALEGGPVQ